LLLVLLHDDIISNVDSIHSVVILVNELLVLCVRIGHFAREFTSVLFQPSAFRWISSSSGSLIEGETTLICTIYFTLPS